MRPPAPLMANFVGISPLLPHSRVNVRARPRVPFSHSPSSAYEGVWHVRQQGQALLMSATVFADEEWVCADAGLASCTIVCLDGPRLSRRQCRYLSTAHHPPQYMCPCAAPARRLRACTRAPLAAFPRVHAAAAHSAHAHENALPHTLARSSSPLLSAPSPHVRPQDTIILQPLYYCSPKITGMRTSTLAAVLAAAGVCRLACGGVANSDGCRRPRVACQRLCALEMSARETKWEKRPTITHNPGVIMRPRLCVDAGAAGAGSSSRGLRASATRSR